MELQEVTVDAAWLLKHHEDEQVKVLDVRWYYRASGREAYTNGHIPGATFVDLDRDLAGAPGIGGRHPLPSVEAFSDSMRAAGIHSESCVVVYDDASGMIGGRLWWMLRACGHASVAVLDGGLAEWCRRGYPLSIEIPLVEPGNFVAQHDFVGAVSVEDLERLRDEGVPILDARSAARYLGHEEPMDAHAGHIPGALSAPFADNLTGAGVFKSDAELRHRFAALGVGDTGRVVVYCGSGVSACHNLVALEKAGLTGGLLFTGSWSEWLSDPSRAIATDVTEGTSHVAPRSAV